MKTKEIKCFFYLAFANAISELPQVILSSSSSFDGTNTITSQPLSTNGCSNFSYTSKSVTISYPSSIASTVSWIGVIFTIHFSLSKYFYIKSGSRLFFDVTAKFRVYLRFLGIGNLSIICPISSNELLIPLNILFLSSSSRVFIEN